MANAETTRLNKVEYNRQLAYQICETLSIKKGGDVEPHFALYRDDAIIQFQTDPRLFPLCGPYTKQEYHDHIYRESREADLLVNVEGVTADQDRLAVEASSDMEYQGFTYKNLYHWLFEIKDGRIAKARFYFDTILGKHFLDLVLQAKGKNA